MQNFSKARCSPRLLHEHPHSSTEKWHSYLSGGYEWRLAKTRDVSFPAKGQILEMFPAPHILFHPPLENKARTGLLIGTFPIKIRTCIHAILFCSLYFVCTWGGGILLLGMSMAGFVLWSESFYVVLKFSCLGGKPCWHPCKMKQTCRNQKNRGVDVLPLVSNMSSALCIVITWWRVHLQ